MKQRIADMAILAGILMVSAGCGKDVVYQRSVAELNQKAAQLMSQGDTAGAVSRLESAHDLMPEESSILFNLAIAYKENGQLDKSIGAFETFVEKYPGDKMGPEARKSLAVVLEEKGDSLIGEALKAKEEKKEDIAQGKARDGLAYYERAAELYKAVLETGNTEHAEGENAEQVSNHLKNLAERIDQIRQGKLDPVGFF